MNHALGMKAVSRVQSANGAVVTSGSQDVHRSLPYGVGVGTSQAVDIPEYLDFPECAAVGRTDRGQEGGESADVGISEGHVKREDVASEEYGVRLLADGATNGCELYHTRSIGTPVVSKSVGTAAATGSPSTDDVDVPVSQDDVRVDVEAQLWRQGCEGGVFHGRCGGALGAPY